MTGLVRRRVRVGGCSEAWRELDVRLDTKPAPWLKDNGPWLVSGCRWSEGTTLHARKSEYWQGRDGAALH
eukprot:scaffold145055_cov136-Phaeocystis_antarctica.AAC.1